MVKTIEWIVETGEDAGKIFEISAFTAFTGDRWARHVVNALSQSSSKVLSQSEKEKEKNEEMVKELGMAGLASLELAQSGLQIFSFMESDAQEKALSALLNCCKIKRNSEKAKDILEIDIQDPMTLIELRTRAFILNMGFMKAGIRQVSLLASTLLDNWVSNNEASQPNTETSAI